MWTRGSLFDADSPGEAARTFKRASVGLVVSLGTLPVLFWAVSRGVGRGLLPRRADLVLLVAVLVVQGVVAAAFVRAGAEYVSWVASEFDRP